MRAFQVVLLVMLVILALSGCSLQCGNPTTEGGQTPAAVPAPTPPPTAPAKAPEAAGPKVMLLETGDQFKPENNEMIHKTATFTPETKTIYVVASIKGMQKGTKIKGTLQAVEVVTKDGTKVRDTEVTSTEVEAPGPEATVHFSFGAPTAGWPKGSYVTKIAVEGKDIDSADLTVK